MLLKLIIAIQALINNTFLFEIIYILITILTIAINFILALNATDAFFGF